MTYTQNDSQINYYVESHTKGSTVIKCDFRMNYYVGSHTKWSILVNLTHLLWLTHTITISQIRDCTTKIRLLAFEVMMLLAWITYEILRICKHNARTVSRVRECRWKIWLLTLEVMMLLAWITYEILRICTHNTMSMSQIRDCRSKPWLLTPLLIIATD